ncbi:hypothetical protein BGX20_008695 [Mortierella sp. AD010]|nr:hypothetical protein BGX20_008695 [Mortierella sp. AD010]
MPSPTIVKRLVVFDFDWTLIEADSDIWVIQNFGEEIAKEQEELSGKVQWTDLQCTPEMIAALRLMKLTVWITSLQKSSPIPPISMIKAVSMLHATTDLIKSLTVALYLAIQIYAKVANSKC